MSMISDSTLKLEDLLNDCEYNYDRGLDIIIDEDIIKTLREAITTIKELSAKLASANMEGSKVYYNGNRDRELLDRYDVCDVLEFGEDVDCGRMLNEQSRFLGRRHV